MDYLITAKKSWAIALAAPTKFRPNSEILCEGHPRLDANRLKAAKKLCVVISDTASRWIAFVAERTKYLFEVRVLRPLKFLMSNGPAKSNPVVVKGLEIESPRVAPAM